MITETILELFFLHWRYFDQRHDGQLTSSSRAISRLALVFIKVHSGGCYKLLQRRPLTEPITDTNSLSAEPDKVGTLCKMQVNWQMTACLQDKSEVCPFEHVVSVRFKWVTVSKLIWDLNFPAVLCRSAHGTPSSFYSFESSISNWTSHINWTERLLSKKRNGKIVVVRYIV